MPKKTVEAIIETNKNYIIGVKKNQKDLYKNIEAITSEGKMVCSKFVELLKNRGRTERRTVWVYSGTDEISSAWAGVKQLIKVHRWVKEKGRIREEHAFFISSLIGNAQTFCYAIKSHWGIENSLHWVKDVTFNEDSSRIRTSNAPENTSVFRNIVINVFRINDYSNLAQAQRLVCNDINKLKQLLN